MARSTPLRSQIGHWSLISEDDQRYLLKADLPEMKKDDVKVTVEDGILSVSGERKTQKEAQKEEATSFPLKMPRSCWSGQYRTWDDSLDALSIR